MKNLYNTIEQNLKAGLQVVVKDLENNDYLVISNSRDEDGNYRDSGWCGSIERTKQYIGSCSGHSKEYWDEFDLEIVEVYRPEYEPFKVGDKVRLLDSIKKINCWNDFKKHFPNMTGEIEEICFDKEGTFYNINSCYIGHEFLAPLVEQEDNVALEAIKLLEEKGYKIIKK